MATKFIYMEDKNLIAIQTVHEDIAECENAENIRLRILLLLFLNQNVRFITLQPQKYSIGYEMPSRRRLEIGGNEILVNELNICDRESLKMINESEDFNRGLLIIVSGQEPLDSLIKPILTFQKTMDITCITFNSLVSFCNYDSNYFYLLNSPLKLQEIKSL